MKIGGFMINETLIGIAIGCILLITVYRSKIKGDIGELVAAKFLNNLNANKYKVIHGIKIKNPTSHTKTSQIDHLVLSKYGIFAVETKTYKGKIYGKEYSRNWS